MISNRWGNISSMTRSSWSGIRSISRSLWRRVSHQSRSLWRRLMLVRMGYWMGYGLQEEDPGQGDPGQDTVYKQQVLDKEILDKIRPGPQQTPPADSSSQALQQTLLQGLPCRLFQPSSPAEHVTVLLRLDDCYNSDLRGSYPYRVIRITLQTSLISLRSDAWSQLSPFKVRPPIDWSYNLLKSNTIGTYCSTNPIDFPRISGKPSMGLVISIYNMVSNILELRLANR